METALQFKRIANEETSRLEGLCTKWQDVLESIQCTDDVRDQIRTVIGQTKLLLKEKIQQFKDLLNSYESGRGDVDITTNDIEGFWDLVSLQIHDVTAKFCELDNDIVKFRRR